MNKFVIPILLISIILVAGCASQQPTTPPTTQTLPQSTLSAATLPAPAVKEFNMTAKRFEFTPGTITVNKGDEVVINAVSLDVTHGFSIPEYNIVETLSPGMPKTIRFTADKAGRFTFSCSVYCGSGHSAMSGTLIVNP